MNYLEILPRVRALAFKSALLVAAGTLAAGAPAIVQPAAAQDFNKGLKAYKQQRFAAARAEFQPLAQAGNARAQYYMGALFAQGRGVERDLDKAEGWISRAAAQGHARALYSLGNLHRRRGETVEAIRYFRQSAEKGIRSAQYNLGVMYATGDGVEKAPEEAIKWYRQAAENGHANAQYNLGVFYREGLGTPADPKRALEWLTQAAENGNAFAQINLARMYTLGNGVPKDLTRAYKWLEVLQHPFGKAGANGVTANARIADIRNSAVAARKLLEEQMPPGHVARAKSDAQGWLAERGSARK